MTIQSSLPGRLLRAVLTALFLVSLLGIPGGVAEARELSIRCLTVKNGYPSTGAFLHDGSGRSGKALDVKEFLNHKRQEIKVDGNELVFTSESGAKSRDDDRLVFGRVTLPEGVTSCLFVFEPPVGERPARVHCIDDSLPAFPAGSFKILNLSGVELRLELEGESFEMPLDEPLLIDEVPVGKRNAAAAKVYKREGEDWKMVSSGSWTHPGKKRVFYVAKSDKTGRYFDVTGIRDISMPR